MVSDPNRSAPERKTVAAPTLIIGLGGTGAQVLSRVRERVFTELGPLDDFPIVRYLWLDTDTRNTSPDFQNHPEIAQQLQFRNYETVPLLVPDTEAYMSRLYAYPHISRWIYPHLNAKDKIVDGAGQIRAYGRMAFFVNIDTIRARLDTALETVLGMPAQKEAAEHNLLADSGQLNVIIVTSVAGGTGSGTFLDMAYLVRQQVRRFGGHRQLNMIGFLVLPSAFGNAGEMSRLYANGYAGLKELNHYNYAPPTERGASLSELRPASDHDYTLWWSADESATTTSVTPFDVCYLVDGNHQQGSGVGGKIETIYSMVAENIFHDFSMGAFSGEKRSHRDNLLKEVNTDAKPLLELPGADLKLPKRYFSFGMASITFPYKRVERACKAKLAEDVLDYWLRQQDDQVSPIDYLNGKFLPNLNFVESEGVPGQPPVHHVLDALFASGPGGQTMQNEVLQSIGAAVRDVAERGTDREGESWDRLLGVQVKRLTAAWEGELSSDPREWGDAVRRICLARDVYLKGLQERLEAEIKLLINNEHRGIGFARAVLDALEDRLERAESGYIATWTKATDGARGRLPVLRDEMERLLAELHHYWDMSNWHRLRDITLQKLLERFDYAANQLFQEQVRYTAYTLAIGIGQEVRQWIADERKGWRVRLLGLQDGLHTLKNALRREFDAFAELQEDYREILLCKSKDEVLQLYQECVPDPTEYARKQSKDVLAKLGMELMDLPAVDMELACHRLKEAVGDRFASLQHKDAFTLFHNKYKLGSAAWEEKISAMVKACQAWVAWEPGFTGVKGKLDSEKARFLLGVSKSSAGPAYADFVDKVLARFTGLAQDKVYNLESPHQIVFYTEVAGFALCQTTAVRPMREQYLKVAADSHSALHTDKKDAKFSELVMLEPDERLELRNCTRAYLLGSILGLVTTEEWKDNRGNRDVNHKYLQRRPGRQPQTLYLGFDNAVVPYLRSKKDSVLQNLVDEIARRQSDLLPSRDACAQYAAVAALWLDTYFPERQIELANGVTETLPTMEYVVLEEELRRVMSMMDGSFNRDVKLKRQMLENFTVVNLDGRRVLNLPAADSEDAWRIG